MDKEKIKKILEAVQSGGLPVDKAIDQLKSLPYDDLGFAKIDTHRALRRGFPEVIFCQGKTVDQVCQIVQKMMDHNRVILGMRAVPEIHHALTKITDTVEYNEHARAFVVGTKPGVTAKGTILIVSAGTADMPVAEEAALTAEVKRAWQDRGQPSTVKRPNWSRKRNWTDGWSTRGRSTDPSCS